ncbi:MAG: 4-(cytidine 5'-diphospho)-2-C-methyl-D-erythritol kinase, partial [Magnetococcales bacterium]|nr:4-(cytidine 5'-diphospho)-2-C-methyl-D-erythritol kinase [Magnetococcales bacterium]
MALGLTLGADIPFFLFGQTAQVAGIGEQLTALPDQPEQPMVLVYPGVVLATAMVFRRFHERLTMTDQTAMLPPESAPDNDLQLAAMDLAPVLGMAWCALQSVDAKRVWMSGSGSTLCGLFDSAESADAAAARLRRDHPEWSVFSGTTFNQHPLRNS